MTANESLAYLHTHWVLPDHFEAPPGPPWRRRVWQVVGRLTFGVLARYLSEERDLLSQAVQLCDTLARRVDSLQAEMELLAAATSRQLAELAVSLPDLTGGELAVTGAGTDPDGNDPDGTDPGGNDPGGTGAAGDAGGDHGAGADRDDARSGDGDG